MPVIKFHNVNISYFEKKQEIEVFDNFNFTFDSGLIHVIFGPSGSGKTTLLKALYDGVYYEGEIFWDHQNIGHLKVNERNMAMVAQNYALYPHMTIFENIAFPLKNMGASQEEIMHRVYQISEEFGISACLSRKPRHLSSGQQQRVCLARALIKKPRLCLFDEPMSNLDELTKGKMYDLIRSALKKRDITTLYITHDINEAMQIADVIHIMNAGKIVFSGTPNDIIDSENPMIKKVFPNYDYRNL